MTGEWDPSARGHEGHENHEENDVIRPRNQNTNPECRRVEVCFKCFFILER